MNDLLPWFKAMKPCAEMLEMLKRAHLPMLHEESVELAFHWMNCPNCYETVEIGAKP